MLLSADERHAAMQAMAYSNQNMAELAYRLRVRGRWVWDRRPLHLHGACAAPLIIPEALPCCHAQPPCSHPQRHCLHWPPGRHAAQVQ